MACYLYYSNNLGSLSQSFYSVYDSVSDLFSTRPVVVPNPQTAKWLNLSRLKEKSTSFGLDYHYGEKGLAEYLYSSSENEGSTLIDEKDVQWIFYHTILTQSHSSLQRLKDYCTVDGKVHHPRNWNLSQSLSRYFHQYHFYRPTDFHSWTFTRQKDEISMGEKYLHSQLLSLKKDLHLVTHGDILAREYHTSSEPLFFFNVNHYQPLMIQFIYNYSIHNDVYIYQVNPCGEFWEDVESHTSRWKKIQAIKTDTNSEGEYLTGNENDNRFLSLWGAGGRETLKLFSMLEETLSPHLAFQSFFLEPQEKIHTTQLSQLQNSIYRLENDVSAVPDGSIEIVRGGTIRDEVSFIYHTILQLLAKHEDLKPTDIAIYTTDLPRYLPAIQSVFQEEKNSLQYSIIDGTDTIHSDSRAALMELVGLKEKTITIELTLEILQNPLFMKKWLSFEEIQTLWSFFEKNNLLQADIQQSDLFTILRVQKLLKGSTPGIVHMNSLAMPLYDNIPWDTVERFIQYGEFLSAAKTSIARAETLSQWQKVLQSLSDIDLSLEIHLSTVETSLTHFSQLNRTTKIQYETFKLMVSNETVDKNASFGSYLTTGINISSLVPNRNIPFRVVFIAGLNEGIFPGQREESTLNLLKGSRRIGDTNQYIQETYLFLQLLTSVEDKLILSYIDRDIVQQKDLLPSSIISTLKRELSLPETKVQYITSLPEKTHPPLSKEIFRKRPLVELSLYDLMSFISNPAFFYLAQEENIYGSSPMLLSGIDTLHTRTSIRSFSLYFSILLKFLSQRETSRNKSFHDTIESMMNYITYGNNHQTLDEMITYSMIKSMEDLHSTLKTENLFHQFSQTPYYDFIIMNENIRKRTSNYLSLNPYIYNGKNRRVSISGYTEGLWQSDGSTVYLCKGYNNPTIVTLLRPLLMHALGLTQSEGSDIKKGFIHLFTPEKRTLFELDMTPKDAEEYLQLIIEDCIFEKSYSYIPVDMILQQKKLVTAIGQSDNPGEFYNDTMKLIVEKDDDSFSNSFSKELDSLLPRSLPEDILQILQRRIKPLLSFVKEVKQ